MGATIQPDFERKAVPFARTSCCDCGTGKVVSYDEWRYDSSWWCGCGGLYSEPNFYPTEFPWAEASWTYTNVQAVITQLGGEFDYCGRISTQKVMSNLHRIDDPKRRDVIRRIAELADRLQVDIIWG